jgi:pimeloyl-ACP methyl ester carboxylesterase
MLAWRALFALLLRGTCLALVGFGCSDTTRATETAPGGAFINVGSRLQPLRLWLEETGVGDPILLLHGFGGNSYTWHWLAPRLARTHHVISVDLKGFGRSDKPFDAAYGVLDQAHLLATLIRRKGLRKLSIVGHSFGGGVALALTANLNQTQPELVQRLVLIDSIAYPQPLPLFLELLRTPVLAEVGVYTAPPELETYKGLVAAYADPQKITLDTVRAYARPLYTPGGRHALIQTAQEIIPRNLPALIARYRSIEQPTLLLWCAADPVVPLSVGRRLLRALPRARLTVLKGCGHMPQEELPATTLAILRAFLG